jgi:SAM-dependent methyltransferase
MSTVWTPAPRYLLRKYCALRLLHGLAPGRVLEIGCAQGDMLRTLGDMGYTGLGVDISEEAVQQAGRTLAGLAGRMRAAPVGEEKGTGPYDLICAFEVLEHIEDDRSALAEWRPLLKSGGRLLLSVPSHPHQWGPSDEAVGHFRRYTRQGLQDLLAETGFVVEHLWCYGVPIANISHFFTNLLHRRGAEAAAGATQTERSGRSGIDRSAIAPLGWLWNNPLFRVFCWVQMLFLLRDCGNGYVVRARAV